MKGFAHIGVVVVIVVALLGVGYVAFTVRPESPVQLPSPTQSSQTVSLEQIAALEPPAVYTIEYKDAVTGRKLFTMYKDHDKVRHDRALDTAGQIQQQLFSIGGREYICDRPTIDASWTCFESSEDISMVFAFPENKGEAMNLARGGTNTNYKGFIGTRRVVSVDAPCFASEWRSEAVQGKPLETVTLCYHPDVFLKLVDQSVLGNRNIVAEHISLDPIPPRIFAFPDPAFTPHGRTTPLVDVSNWKTYRNDEAGLEFRYPAAINGKTVTPIVQSINPRDALALGLYSSSIPFAPPYPPEYGIRGAPSLHNVLGVQVVDLKRPPHYFSTGHFGGFEYDSGRDRWRETDGEGGYVRELTWDSFLTAVSAKPFGRDIFLVTATSPAGGGDYINDPRTRYYYLMNREQKKYAVVQHFAFADASPTAVQDSIRAQFNAEADTVSDIARQMLDTITFLP